MRRAIFSTNTQTASGLIYPVSNAGVDQSKSAGVTSVNLDGAASYDLDGTITTYLWTQVSGDAATITTPNVVATSITGLSDNNTYVFRLTVTDNDTQQHSDDIIITISNFTPNVLQITSSIPSGIKTGTLSFTGGEPYETIGLSFLLSSTQTGDSVDFSGAQTGTLDHEHPLRLGSVILDSAGDVTKNYAGAGTPVFECLVTITSRNSEEDIPNSNTTYIVFPVPE